MSTHPNSQKELWGFVYGFIGILVFCLTLPATKLALESFDPVFVGLGRALVAAGLSLILLVVKRQRLPPLIFLPNFCIVVAGVIVGFPLLTAIAMQDAPASHGAVITGLAPLSTAIWAVWRAGERPSIAFWVFAILGSALVISFALLSGSGTIRFADLALLGAVVAVGLGYAEGAVLSRKLGAWQVICWSLLLSAPMLIPIVWHHAPSDVSTLSFSAVIGLLYLGIFSMFLGFIAWYRGLSLGGVAHVGQVQLLQPFLTIVLSAILLGEPLTLTTLVFATGVIVCVALGKLTQIRTS